MTAWSEPAEETGGDKYNVIVINEDPPSSDTVQAGRSTAVYLLLADASGHGIGPALCAMQTHSLFRVGVAVRDRADDIARLINHQLCSDLPDALFVTAWVGKLNPSGGISPMNRARDYSVANLFEATFDENANQLRIRLTNYCLRAKEELLPVIESISRVLTQCNPSVLVFDLSGQELVTSATLGLFVRFRNDGRVVQLANPTKNVREILNRTNLDRYFDVLDQDF